MKGKLILTDIQSPAEGMHVVWVKDDNNPKRVWKVNELPGLGMVGLEWIHQYIALSELKQIVVEYGTGKEYLAGEVGGNEIWDEYKETLPLHPDDWEWAIKHIGEEVEFEVEAGLKTWPNGSVTGFIDIAKLIHPTPITYTEEEAKDLIMAACAQVLMDIVKLKVFDPKQWWNEHKKK